MSIIKSFISAKILPLLLICFLTSCSGGGTAGTGGGSVLRATLINANQQPLPNVSVTVLEDSQKAVSDNAGTFSFTLDKNGGLIQLRFDGAGLNAATVSVQIPESNGTVFVIFKGDIRANQVVESDLRVEDRSENDSNDDSSDNSDTNDDHGNGGSGSDSNNGSDDNGGSNGSEDDGQNGGGNSGSGNSGNGNSGSGGSGGGDSGDDDSSNGSNGSGGDDSSNGSGGGDDQSGHGGTSSGGSNSGSGNSGSGSGNGGRH